MPSITELQQAQQDTRDPGPNWLAGESQMAAFIRRMAWHNTPLGPLNSWPQSLRTTVSVCLASSFPISIAWGKHCTQIYNDGYWPICGAKHPRSMGQDFRECWAAPWPVIGEAFEQAMRGNTSFLENQRMFLDRNGYIEETCFTFSFSPIRDESGGIGGLFHPVLETTSAMLAARRSRLLRDISALSGRALDVEDAFSGCLDILAQYDVDVPFAALYFASEGSKLQPVGTFGLPAHGLPANYAWPLELAVNAQQMTVLENLPATHLRLCCAPYEEPVQRAIMLPLRVAGVQGCAGVLLLGASPRLPFDEHYQGFVEMLGGGVGAVISSARTYQQERQRAEELATLDRAKTAFFSNVSHEFRTPLTLILGPAEDLLNATWGLLQPQQMQQLETLHRNALRLLRLVNSLLDFSRIEANRAQACFTETDLASFTTDLASAFRAAIEHAGMQLDVFCDPLPRNVYVDRDMWEKIVLNLLSNAFKYTLAGRISVRQRLDGGHVLLEVEDTGLGIPPEEVTKVFERFHRVQGARGRTHEGTGIGLALVRELARLHGGTAEVRSVAGKGSVFSIRIPVGDAHLPEGAVRQTAQKLESTALHADAFVEEALRWLPSEPAHAPPSPPAAHSNAAGPRKRVLVADDNADMRAYVAKLLEGRYEVVAVGDGQAALEEAESTPADLILTDVMMPIMDGFELLQKIRAHPVLHTMPLILLSARAGDEARSEGIEAGADDYIVKPFSARELTARVQTQLSLAELRLQATEREVMAAHVDDLRKIIAKRDEFLCVASHELKTPLTSLMLQVQAARRRMLKEGGGTLSPERIRQIVESTNLQVSRIARLVDDMLDASRLETGALHLQVEEFELADMIHTVLERMRGQLDEASLEVHVNAPRVVVHWDRFRIEQVLINLLTNAIRYGGHEPVQVIAEEDGAHIRVTVRDHGAGIPVKDQERIFERFERATSASEVSGLGLGLYIAANIVQMHGGVINVESEPGAGAAFRFEIPRDTHVKHDSANRMH